MSEETGPVAPGPGHALSLFDQLKNSVDHNPTGPRATASSAGVAADEWRSRRDVEDSDSSNSNSESSEKSIKSSVEQASRLGGGSEDANDTTSSSLSLSLPLTSTEAAAEGVAKAAASLLKCSLHKSSESLPETGPAKTTAATTTAALAAEAAAATATGTAGASRAPASAAEGALQAKGCQGSPPPSHASAKVLPAKADAAATGGEPTSAAGAKAKAKAVVGSSSSRANHNGSQAAAAAVNPVAAATAPTTTTTTTTAAGAARSQFPPLLPPPAPPGASALADRHSGQKGGGVGVGIVLGTKRPSAGSASVSSAAKAKHAAAQPLLPHRPQPQLAHAFGACHGAPFAVAHKVERPHQPPLGLGGPKKGSATPAGGPRSADRVLEGEKKKKKRCADRYDSSESSDSGVATSLSCTDSSTGSSEDASEPGSPYSPQSIIGDDHNQHQLLVHRKMPPQTILATATAATNSTNAATANTNSSTQHNTAINNIATVSSSHTASKLKSQPTTQKSMHPNGCTTANAKLNANALPSLQKISANAAGMQSLWPWNNTGAGSTVGPVPVAGGNQGKKRNANTNTDSTAKKSRASNVPSSSLHEKSSGAATVSTVQPSSNSSQMSGNANTPKRLKAAALEESQTKITGYFKSQMKSQIHQNLNGKRQEFATNSSIASGMTTSALTMSTPATTASLNKYFNILSQIKENNTNRDPQPKAPLMGAITSSSGVTTLTTTVASTSTASASVPNSITISPSTMIPVPALKKIERSKPTKIAQVAPNLRKTTSGNTYAGAAPGKSPKKHVAIAPRTPDMKINLGTAKEVAPKQQQQQPAVLLTAIRMPTQSPQQQQTTPPQPHHTSNAILATQTQLKHPSTAAKVPATPPTAGVVTPVTTAGAASSAASNTTLYQLPVQLPNLVQLPQLLAANGPNIMQLNSAAKATPSTTTTGTSAQAAQAAAAQYFLNGTVFKLQQFTTATTTTATSAVAAAGTAPNVNPFNFMNANDLQEILLKQQQQQQIQLQQHQKSSAANTAASAAANIASFQEIFQQQVAAAVVASQQQQQQQQFQQLQRLSAATNIQQPVFMATPAGLLLNAATLPAMLAQAAAAIAANNNQQQQQKSISMQQQQTQQLPALQPIQTNAMPALSSIFGSANPQAPPTVPSQTLEPCAQDLQSQQQLQHHQQMGQLALVQPQQQQFITGTQPPPLSVVSSNTSSNNNTNTSTQSPSAPKLAIVKANTSQFSALSSQPPPLVTISSSSSATKARPQVAAVAANGTNITMNQSKPSALAKPYQKRTPKISPSAQTKTITNAKTGKLSGGKIVATPTTPPPLVPASSSPGTSLVINKTSPCAHIPTSNIKATPALVSIQPIQTANQLGVKMPVSSNISPILPSPPCSETLSNKLSQQLKSSSTKDLFDLVKNSSNTAVGPNSSSDGNFKKIKDEPMDEPPASSTSMKAEIQTFSSHLRSDIKLELLEDATKMSSSNASTMQECSSSSFSSHSNSVSSSADLSLEASTAASLTSSAPSPVPSSESALLNSPQPTPGSTCDSNSNSCTATTAASLATSQDHLNDLSSLSSTSSSTSSIHLSLSDSSGSRGKSSTSSENTEEGVGKRDLPTPESGIGGSLSNSQSSSSLASTISNIASKASSPDLETLNSMPNAIDSLLPSAAQSTESNCCETQTDTRPPVVTVVTPTTIDIQIAENSSNHLPKAAISPILSQPKTIRFPAESGFRYGSKGAKRHDGVCYWNKCNKKHDSSSKLLDHMQTQHVNSQTGPFSCLWVGCKVYNKESCSRRWLERHVLSHGGSKQFKCIVEGCGLRFGSQLALQKHVNNHFNATENKDCTNKRTSDPPVPKQLRKNGKKLRYRRQPFSARMFDFFDAGIMEGLQHRLRQISTLTNGCNSITFQGQCMMKRRNIKGTYECFIRWSPREIISDEWLPECNEPYVKTVNIKQMHPIEKTKVESLLMTAYRLPYSPNLFEHDLSDNYQENGGDDDCNSGKSDAGESDKDEDDNDDDIDNETSISETEAHDYASTVSNYQQVLSIAKLQMQQRKKHPRKPQKRIQLTQHQQPEVQQ